MTVDFHCHVFPPEIKKNREQYVDRDPCFAILYSNPEANMATAEELIADMDQSGIDISVIVNIGWTTHDLCVETNDYIIDAFAPSSPNRPRPPSPKSNAALKPA
jgi:predicted TIM-barrel fold metal-dependent hydrolase